MAHSDPLCLALREAGQASPRYFTAAEKGLLTFSFVDFKREKPFQVPLCEVENCPPAPHSYPRSDYQPPAYSAAQYQSLVREALEQIHQKQLDKIVLSRPHRVATEADPLLLFHRLRAAYPQATVYLFTHPEIGTWLGATPETLLQYRRPQVQTVSLAGTRRADSEKPFTAKEEAEQQWVTDFIYEELDAHQGVSDIRIGNRQIWPAGPLEHLRTEISAVLAADKPLDQLVARLHPTPAVAGAPREAALALIAALEKHPRRYYSGYLGLQKKGAAHYYVNLRCGEFVKGGFVAYAGGGITAQSDPAAEWEETENKLQTILSHLPA